MIGRVGEDMAVGVQQTRPKGTHPIGRIDDVDDRDDELNLLRAWGSGQVGAVALWRLLRTQPGCTSCLTHWRQPANYPYGYFRAVRLTDSMFLQAWSN